MHELISDFKKYSKETGEIKMFLCDKKGNPIEYKNTSRYAPLKLIIQYYKDNHGIEWSVDSYTNYAGFLTYKVSVKINPKILGGVHDYITAATYNDMEAAIENFNLESEKIFLIEIPAILLEKSGNFLFFIKEHSMHILKRSETSFSNIFDSRGEQTWISGKMFPCRVIPCETTKST